MSQIVDDPALQGLFAYWLRQKGQRLMPSRADLDPVEMTARLLPHVTLQDVVYDAGRRRYRYRLIGSVLQQALGVHALRKYVDETVPNTAGYRDYVIAIYDEMVETRQPIYCETVFALATFTRPVLSKRLTMPLSSDGETVDMAFVGHSIEYPNVAETASLIALEGFKVLERRYLGR
ncbi:MAG: PAS domain-containing protein [Proteobacteria bacterium]|nr:PAS domain-containing protein [Pseudomonadota bacterium]MBI3496936.1 PAS domain-containing protein [Pseudomonadota bacterium]